jgi:hypothetical protein
VHRLLRAHGAPERGAPLGGPREGAPRAPGRDGQLSLLGRAAPKRGPR